MHPQSFLDLIAYIIGISVMTGIFVASLMRGQLAWRQGLAWGLPFALAMLVFATPSVLFALMVKTIGWPDFLGDRHARQWALFAMAVVGLAASLTIRPFIKRLSEWIAD